MKIDKSNAIILSIYIYIPFYFFFISAILQTYLLEYICIFFLIIYSFFVNLNQKIPRNKIYILFCIYILIHVLRDLIWNEFFYYDIYKKIFYRGILVIYFFRAKINFTYLKNILYKETVIYFYFFYIQYFLITNLNKYVDYMGFGFNLMFPASIFLFSFVLNIRRKKRDLFYGMIMFFNILIAGNRSPILIISIMILFILLLKKKIISLKLKMLLIITTTTLVSNLKWIIYLLNENIFFKNSRLIIKFIQYYEKEGTGLLAQRNFLYDIYFKKIKSHLFLGNFISSKEIEMGKYSHNIIIDIFYHNGIIIGVIIILFLLSLLKIKRQNFDVLKLSFFSMFFILFFSSYYIIDRNFYIFICYLFYNNLFSKGKKNV